MMDLRVFKGFPSQFEKPLSIMSSIPTAPVTEIQEKAWIFSYSTASDLTLATFSFEIDDSQCKGAACEQLTSLNGSNPPKVSHVLIMLMTFFSYVLL